MGIKAPGDTFQIPNVSQYHHHSCWSNNQFSDPRVSKSGHRTLLGSIPVKAIGFQKHQVPTLLAKQPLYKGGSEPAENHIPVSCCLKLFSSLNVIMQAQCPWTTTHGRVVHGKTCLRKISSNSAHLKISLRKKKCLEYFHSRKFGFSFCLSAPISGWSEGSPRTAQQSGAHCELKQAPRLATDANKHYFYHSFIHSFFHTEHVLMGFQIQLI